MTVYPRVAFMPDTFFEVNGVAHTARHLEGFARRRQIPFLSVHCGPQVGKTNDGPVSILQLKRGPARIGLDANLHYDPFLWLNAERVKKEARDFGAELIHITGPGDLGAIGLYVAKSLRLPLVISWHTSLHEYAGVRLRKLLSFTGEKSSRVAGIAAEAASIQILRRFYSRATLTMAPNQELVDLTYSLTKKPSHLMRRGVDAALFNPSRRTRTSNAFRIGYVGRLTPEKSVRFLAVLGNSLIVKGHPNFEFVIVGEGSEEAWLRAHVPNANFTGVLRGEPLAEAYANMDLFVFPSNTDTFGNVILEALASGVPCVVTSQGGPKFLVDSGISGFVAASDAEFIGFVDQLMLDPILHARMRCAALEYGRQQSWDCVFESVYRTYSESIRLYSSVHPVSASLLSSRMHGRGSS